MISNLKIEKEWNKTKHDINTFRYTTYDSWYICKIQTSVRPTYNIQRRKLNNMCARKGFNDRIVPSIEHTKYSDRTTGINKLVKNRKYIIFSLLFFSLLFSSPPPIATERETYPPPTDPLLVQPQKLLYDLDSERRLLKRKDPFTH